MRESEEPLNCGSLHWVAPLWGKEKSMSPLESLWRLCLGSACSSFPHFSMPLRSSLWGLKWPIKESFNDCSRAAICCPSMEIKLGVSGLQEKRAGRGVGVDCLLGGYGSQGGGFGRLEE
ncbi:hypothetical protein AMTR_s00182p00012370, partial [Amborella trichopoda]